jgi:hypothetical protein
MLKTALQLVLAASKCNKTQVAGSTLVQSLVNSSDWRHTTQQHCSDTVETRVHTDWLGCSKMTDDLGMLALAYKNSSA